MTEHEPVRFETKIVVVIREDLPVWQKLNMTSFLASGVAAAAPESVGEHYEDADSTKYVPMFGEPVLVFAATAAELARTLDRALSRGAEVSVFTADLFATGHDAANRAAVASIPRSDLALTGLALRTNRQDADKVTKGLHLHS